MHNSTPTEDTGIPKFYPHFSLGVENTIFFFGGHGIEDIGIQKKKKKSDKFWYMK